MMDKKFVNSNIPTLDASNMTYEFEKGRAERPEFAFPDISAQERVRDAQTRKTIPDNLEYLDDFRDAITGTSGTAFLDKNTGEVIISYTGTNPNVDFSTDVETDFSSIGLAMGYHYDEAFKFYEQIQAKYGSNITLTGHSLGGNIAQRVALEYNVSRTIVYNSAPLYLKSTVMGEQKIVDYLLPWDSAREQIINKQSTFTGQVIRITTEKDPLNIWSDRLGGVYLGKEYILDNSGGHSLDPDITSDKNQINQIKDILEKQSPEKMTGLEKKNYETLKKLQEVKNGYLKQLSSQFLSDGSINSHEMFFLDSVQATAVSAAMTETVKNGHSEIESLSKKAVEEAENAYNKCKEIPWFVSVLTYDEVQEAYADAGVTYDTIVGETQQHFDKKLAQSTSIVTAFTDLQSNIQTGLEQAVETDANLAGDINQWSN